MKGCDFPLPHELAFEAKRRAQRRLVVPLATASAEVIVRRAFWRAWWARTRGPVAAILVPLAGALWGVSWHEATVDALKRDNAAMRSLLLADRMQTTLVVSGCGRQQLIESLASATGDLDLYRGLMHRAPK